MGELSDDLIILSDSFNFALRSKIGPNQQKKT